jgi:hypothetical protein
MTDGLWVEARKAVKRCATSYSDPSDRLLNEQVLMTCEDVLYVSIAGSNDVWDWVQNFDHTQIAVGDYHISEGVLSAAKNVMAILVGYLHRHPEAEGKPIQFEGHSKGGAVALACAMLAEGRGLDVSQVITFAAPRITKELIVYNYPVTQFIAAGDPVPSLPPWRPWRPWRHNGTTVKVGKPTAATVVRDWFGSIGRPIKCHLIANYLAVFE